MRQRQSRQVRKTRGHPLPLPPPLPHPLRTMRLRFLPPKVGWTLIQHRHRSQQGNNPPPRLKVGIKRKGRQKQKRRLLLPPPKRLSQSSLLCYHRTWPIQIPSRNKRKRNSHPQWKRTPGARVRSSTRPGITNMSSKLGPIQHIVAAVLPANLTQKPRKIHKIRKSLLKLNNEQTKSSHSH